MQTNDIYNTCLDISNVLNAGDISNARSKVITLLHEINGMTMPKFTSQILLLFSKVLHILENLLLKNFTGLKVVS